jgi:hypothetical protein
VPTRPLNLREPTRAFPSLFPSEIPQRATGTMYT